MSTKVTAWVYEDSEATGNDRLVLLAIADEADDDGTNAYPSIDRIASKCRIPKRTVMRCLSRLEEAESLIVHRPEQRGRGHFNTYVVVMEKGDTLTPTPEPEKVQKGAQRRAPLPDPFQTHRPIDPEVKSTTPLPPTNEGLARREAPGQTIAVSDLFLAFYAIFPRHEKPGDARKAWAQAIRKADPEAIIAGAQRYRDDPNRDPAYTAHPSSWLRAERWEDDPLPTRVNGNGTLSKHQQVRRDLSAWAAAQDAAEQQGAIGR